MPNTGLGTKGKKRERSPLGTTIYVGTEKEVTCNAGSGGEMQVLGGGLEPFTSGWLYIGICQERVWAPELLKLEHWKLHNLRILTIT